MARKGRDLELLIKLIEDSYLPEGAKISSPGFLYDKVTNQKREVDILIEHAIGTTNISIVLECRKRASLQDTTWIEQLKSKLGDLNIDKIIAVSSSSFTEPAKKKAAFYNIETRTISEITKDEISSWWLVDRISTFTQNYFFIAAEIHMENPELYEEAFLDKEKEDKIFISIKDEKEYSIVELIPVNETSVWSLCKLNEPPIIRLIHVNYTNPEDRFYVKVKENKCHILKIVFQLQLSITTSQIPLKRIMKYNSDNKTVSHVMEFEQSNSLQQKNIKFLRNEDGSFRISVSK